MEELYGNIREAVNHYFNEKLKRSSYYGDQQIWDIVDDCVSDLIDTCDEYDKTIDDYIYDKEQAWEDELERLKRKGIKLL